MQMPQEQGKHRDTKTIHLTTVGSLQDIDGGHGADDQLGVQRKGPWRHLLFKAMQTDVCS